MTNEANAVEAEEPVAVDAKEIEVTKEEVQVEKKPEVSSSEPEKIVEKVVDLVEDIPLSKRRANVQLPPTRRSTRIAMKTEVKWLEITTENQKLV